MVVASKIGVQGMPRFNVALHRFDAKRLTTGKALVGIGVAGVVSAVGGFTWAHLSYEVLPLFEMALAWGGMAFSFIAGKAAMSAHRLSALSLTFTQAAATSEDKNLTETQRIFNNMAAQSQKAVSNKIIGKPTTSFETFLAGLNLK